MSLAMDALLPSSLLPKDELALAEAEPCPLGYTDLNPLPYSLAGFLRPRAASPGEI